MFLNGHWSADNGVKNNKNYLICKNFEDYGFLPVNRAGIPCLTFVDTLPIFWEPFTDLLAKDFVGLNFSDFWRETRGLVSFLWQIFCDLTLSRVFICCFCRLTSRAAHFKLCFVEIGHKLVHSVRDRGSFRLRWSRHFVQTSCLARYHYCLWS